MEFIDKIKATIEELQEKDFYLYSIIVLGITLLLMILCMFYYFRSSGRLKKDINQLNKTRAHEVHELLVRAQKVKQYKEKIDTVLSDDPDFIFAGFVESILAKLDLTDKRDLGAPRTTSIDEKYNESALDITLSGINMKQLVDFLALLDEKGRIYTKKIEISKSKTTPNSLEVAMILATLLARPA